MSRDLNINFIVDVNTIAGNIAFTLLLDIMKYVLSYPSGLYDASTMDGEEYAFEVTQVQWTANIINIISTVTITIERMFTPSPKI